MYKNRSDKNLVAIDDIKNINSVVENATRFINILNLDKQYSHVSSRANITDIDKSNVSSHEDISQLSQISQNVSQERGAGGLKRLNSLDECSSLQNIVKQSVEGIFDMLKNDPRDQRSSKNSSVDKTNEQTNTTSTNQYTSNNPKRKKIEFHPNPNKKFDVIEEKEEEQLFKSKNSNNNKNTNSEEANITPIKKVIMKKNLLYSGKSKLSSNISNISQENNSIETEISHNPFKAAAANVMIDINSLIPKQNPTTPKKELYNFRDKKKIGKGTNEERNCVTPQSQNEKDMLSEMNLVIKGIGKMMDNVNLLSKGVAMTPMQGSKNENKLTNDTKETKETKETKGTKETKEKKKVNTNKELINKDSNASNKEKIDKQVSTFGSNVKENLPGKPSSSSKKAIATSEKSSNLRKLDKQPTAVTPKSAGIGNLSSNHIKKKSIVLTTDSSYNIATDSQEEYGLNYKKDSQTKVKNSPISNKKITHNTSNTTRETGNTISYEPPTKTKIPSKLKKKISVCKSVIENIETQPQQTKEIEPSSKNSKEKFESVSKISTVIPELEKKIEIKEILELLYIYNEQSIYLNTDSIDRIDKDFNNSKTVSKILKSAIEQMNRINVGVSSNENVNSPYSDLDQVKLTTDTSSNNVSRFYFKF